MAFVRDGSERRRAPRFALSAQVDFSSGDNFFAGRTRDVSVGGLFIELGHEDASIAPLVDVGNELTLRLRLMGTDFELRAEVMWQLVDDDGVLTGVGVEFREIDPIFKATIDEFIKDREPMNADLGQANDDVEERPSRVVPPPLPKS